jgi:hypothetical protein
LDDQRWAAAKTRVAADLRGGHSGPAEAVANPDLDIRGAHETRQRRLGVLVKLCRWIGR